LIGGRRLIWKRYAGNLPIPSILIEQLPANARVLERPQGAQRRLLCCGETPDARDAERAGRLLGAAKALSPLPANFFSEVSRIDMDQDIAQARAHLDQAAFEAGWAAGQAMTQEQAISYALQDD